MSALSKFFRNTRRPEGIGGKVMLFMMNAGHNKNALWGLSHIEIPPTAEVLDIGCGGGRNIAHLLRRAQNGKVYGVDYAPESVTKSRTLNKTAISVGRGDPDERVVLAL